MCFSTKLSKTAQELKNRFKVKFDQESDYEGSNFNAFVYPKTPIINNAETETIQLYNWGLIPAWSKDDAIRQYTLNARIETLNEKASFRSHTKQRCLIIADAFYEWQWLDSKGKKKQKYMIKKSNTDIFTFAGLWNDWVDKNSGEIVKTYTIITRDANPLMSEIHNSKKRMPLILNQEDELEWLGNQNYKIEDLLKIEVELEAIAV